MALTIIQKVIAGIGGSTILALAVVCGVLYWQNQNKDATIQHQVEQLTTLKGAVEAKELLINEKTMSSNLADLLSQERKTADELRDSYRRDMRSALKDLVLKDEDVRKWLVDLWPAPVLQLLGKTRDRLFPGNSKTRSSPSPAPGNALPADNGK